jgi:hypothetical protein
MKLRLVTSGALTLGALAFGAGPALADGSSTSSAQADTTYTAWLNVTPMSISQGVTGHSSTAERKWNEGGWNSDDSGWRGDNDCDGGSTSSAQADTTYTTWLNVTPTGISQGVTGHRSANRHHWNAGSWNVDNSGWHGDNGACGDSDYRDGNYRDFN